MKNIGDPPQKLEYHELAVQELRTAGIPDEFIKVWPSHHRVPDPGHEATRLAAIGVVIPMALAEVPKVEEIRATITAEYKGWG